jgi:hypothetical protein
MVNEFLLPELRRRDMNIATCWFQQDGATALTARQSKNILRTVFERRIISRCGDISWPTRSPNPPGVTSFRGALEKQRFVSTSGRLT